MNLSTPISENAAARIEGAAAGNPELRHALDESAPEVARLTAAMTRLTSAAAQIPAPTSTSTDSIRAALLDGRALPDLLETGQHAHGLAVWHSTREALNGLLADLHHEREAALRTAAPALHASLTTRLRDTLDGLRDLHAADLPVDAESAIATGRTEDWAALTHAAATLRSLIDAAGLLRRLLGDGTDAAALAANHRELTIIRNPEALWPGYVEHRRFGQVTTPGAPHRPPWPSMDDERALLAWAAATPAAVLWLPTLPELVERVDELTMLARQLDPDHAPRLTA